MLKITGRLLTIKSEKTKNGKDFKRLQLLTNGQRDTVNVVNVKDFENRDYGKHINKDMELPVYAFPWAGKSGNLGIDFVVAK